MYYIYGLIDPINNVPFYIGKGTKNRVHQHLNGKDNLNKRKFKYINNIRNLGHEPIPHIIKYFEDEKEAYEWESYFIDKCVEFKFPLTNRVGVDLIPPSRKGIKWSKESILKRSESFKKNKDKRPPKHISLETRQKISNSLKGQPKKNRIVVNINLLERLYLKENYNKLQLTSYFKIGMGSLNRILAENKIYKVPSLVKR